MAVGVYNFEISKRLLQKSGLWGCLDCLIVALKIHRKCGLKFSLPSKAEDGNYCVEVPSSVYEESKQYSK